MFKGLMLLAALSAATSSAAQAQLVTNGGFEEPNVTNPCCITSPPTDIPGWIATPNVNVVNGTFSSSPPNTNLALEGTQYLDLVGEGGTGSIQQDITTVVGQWYTLSFIYSHNLFAGLTSASADVYLNNVLFASITHTGGNTGNLAWQTFAKDFLATSTTTNLKFVNTVGSTNEGVFLDAISVAGVPEPATWAMMLFGFAGIGMAMRRSDNRKGALAQIA